MKYPKFITDRCLIKTNKHSPHHPKVEHIEPFPKPCEDCNAVVDRMLDLSLVHTPFTYWRVYCKSCNRYQNPITGEFEFKDSRQLSSFLRTKKRVDDK